MKPYHQQSDIFDSYAQIARKRGLLSDFLPTKKASEIDKEELTAIELLYGVKPKGEEKSLLEQAHPEPAIAAPAHDKFNGLVENLQERQDIMAYIARKTPTGHLTQHVYVSAQQELLQEVLKLAFFLDRNNQPQLMALADTCSQNLVKVANPLLIGALVAAGVGLLWTAISQNMHLSQGVVQDCEKAVTELNEAIEEADGHKLKEEMTPLVLKIQALKSAGEKISELKIHPGTEGQTQNAVSGYAALQNGTDQEAIKLMTAFGAGCKDLEKTIEEYLPILKLKAEQLDGTHSDFFAPLIKFKRFIVPTNFEDAIGALGALQQSCKTAPDQMETMVHLFRELRSKGVESVDQFKDKLQGKDLAQEKPSETPKITPGSKTV